MQLPVASCVGTALNPLSGAPRDKLIDLVGFTGMVDVGLGVGVAEVVDAGVGVAEPAMVGVGVIVGGLVGQGGVRVCVGSGDAVAVGGTGVEVLVAVGAVVGVSELAGVGV
jgi:hypothetical protein